jgi:hypothetical protein
MRIDNTHRLWLIASLAIFGISLAMYVPYAMSSPSGPRGGSFLGLVYGIVGYAFMLFAGLLGARKKVPVWRIGRAKTWMRGHLWLGLLSLPLILFHGGFAWRGPLTAVLMTLLFIVVISGVVGAALQHYLPRMMTLRVPMETIYEEIPHVRAQLRDEAENLVTAVFGPLDGSSTAMAPGGGVDAVVAVVPIVDIEHEEKTHFRELYMNTMRPFFANPEAPGAELGAPHRAAEIFTSLRRLLPSSIHPVLADLESICEEERQLNRQVRLYRWLHGWLLVHVPLSIVLLVLGGVHAVMALRY